MITDKEIVEFLDGEMEEAKQESFLQALNSDDDSKKLLREYESIQEGIRLIGIIDTVEGKLESKGFFKSTKRRSLRPVLSIAASTLFFCFSAILYYSNTYYNSDLLVSDNLLAFGQKNINFKYNPKGQGQGQELPPLSPVDQYTNPLMNTVVEALNEERLSTALYEIEAGRVTNTLREVDQMHLDWLEIQVMLLDKKTQAQADRLIRQLAEDRRHYYNNEARALSLKRNSIWSFFVIE